MKYGDFEKESQKTEYGRKIFKAWSNQKLPLSWAIDLFQNREEIIKLLNKNERDKKS